jgi:hypothetical protein
MGEKMRKDTGGGLSVALLFSLLFFGCSAAGTVSGDGGDGGNDGLDGDLDGDGGGGDAQDPCGVEITPLVCDQEIVISESTNVTENIVYPEGTCVRFDGEGALDVAAGVTVTFQSPIIAPLRTIFSGDGKVVAMEVYPQWFGAKCDGVTNDTEAIQRAFDSASIIRPKDGICLIRELDLKESRQIIGDNATFLNFDLDAADLRQYSLLTLHSHSTVKNLRLDGRSKSVIGMEIAPGATDVDISCCHIENFQGNANSPVYGLWMRGNGNIKVSDSVIRHLSGGSDGIIGNQIGANRGILMEGTMSNTLIERCTIDDIGDVEDGDAIQVSSDKQPSYVTIRNCTLTEFKKRAIKLQSSNATVEGNILSSTFATDSEGTACAIALWNADHVLRNNQITLTKGTAGICVEYAKRVQITGNRISVDIAETYHPSYSKMLFGIALDEQRDPGSNAVVNVSEGVTIVGNSIEAHRSPIWGYFCHSTIADNTFVIHDDDSVLVDCGCDPSITCP